jgi:hypothetical protein
MKTATLTTKVNGKVHEVKKYRYKSEKAVLKRLLCIIKYDGYVYGTLKVNATFEYSL